MATEITRSLEMNIYLSSEDDSATRTLKISNPRTDATLAQVTTALAPLFASGAEGKPPLYFFYDEGNQGGYDKAMTKITGAEIIKITKETTPL